MKKIFTIFLVLTLVIFASAIWPKSVLATWTGIDTEFGGTDGDLDGTTGGSGWSGAWSGGNTDYDVQGTTVYSGSKAVQNAALDDLDAAESRTLTTAQTTGTFRIALRRSDVSSNSFQVILRNTEPQDVAKIMFTPTAINLVGNTTVACLASPSANTWYLVDVNFDMSTGTNGTLKCRVDEGTYSSTITGVDDAPNGFDLQSVRLNGNGGTLSGTVFFDNINDGDAVAAAATADPELIFFWNEV